MVSFRYVKEKIKIDGEEVLSRGYRIISSYWLARSTNWECVGHVIASDRRHWGVTDKIKNKVTRENENILRIQH